MGRTPVASAGPPGVPEAVDVMLCPAEVSFKE
jgi:hypothetical protein